MTITKQKSSLLKYAFVAICLAMFVGVVFFAVDGATAGAEITKLERDVVALEAENRELSQAVIKNSSVSSMDSEAASLGFAKPGKTIYLTIEDGLSAYAR